ncbi:MAG: TolC family protein [Myxococcales bacterium]|nr:TolC family protein [Myxococcales bacterium]
MQLQLRMTTRICAFTATTALLLVSAVGHAQPAAYGPDIADELGNKAAKVNASIDAVEQRVGALKESVTTAGAWMNPVLSAEYSNVPVDSFALGDHAMSGVQLKLSQTFYWPGKAAAREEEARARVRQEQLSLAEQKVQLRTSVMRAYYRLALTRQLRSVTREHVKLVKDFLEIVRVKNEAGLVAQHELLRLHVLSDELEDDLKNFDQDERSLTSTINAALRRPIDTVVRTPKQTKVSEPNASAAELIRRAREGRPLLKRYTAEAATHRAAARRAARDGYPDITVWAGYRFRVPVGADAGTDFASVGLAMPLPIFYSQRSSSERRKNEKLAQEAMDNRAAALDDIRGDLGRVVAIWKRSAQKARTYRKDLTPAARLTLDATFASYQVDRADFASLFQAEVQLLNFERATRMAEAAAAEARVDAESIVGSQ